MNKNTKILIGGGVTLAVGGTAWYLWKRRIKGTTQSLPAHHVGSKNDRKPAIVDELADYIKGGKTLIEQPNFTYNFRSPYEGYHHLEDSIVIINPQLIPLVKERLALGIVPDNLM